MATGKPSFLDFSAADASCRKHPRIQESQDPGLQGKDPRIEGSLNPRMQGSKDPRTQGPEGSKARRQGSKDSWIRGGGEIVHRAKEALSQELGFS